MANKANNSVISRVKKIAPFFGALLAVVLVALFLNLFYGNKVFLNTFHNAGTAPQGILLFEKSDCNDCAKVDNFITNNAIAGKVSLTRLQVTDNSTNANILADKAQICGLSPDLIGVPFLWDGKNCILGYVDVINFLKSKLAVKK